MNGTTSPQPDLCLSGARLAASWTYRLVLGAKLVSCLFGLLGNIYVLKTEGIRWLAHPNAKIVYLVHIFWATYVPVAFCVPMGFDFVRFLVPHSDPCDYTLSLMAGFWIRLVGAVGNITQSYTMLAFALERTIATAAPVRYEKVRCSLMGWILGLGAVLVSFSHIICLLVLPNNKFDGKSFVTSILTPANSSSYNIHLSIMMYLECTTVTIFTLNLIVNKIQKRRMKKATEIGLKYQIKETSKLISALLPCFWVHFVIFLTPTLSLSLRRNMQPPLDPIGNIEWIECLSNYQLYSIVMPAVVVILRSQERRRTVVNSHRGMEEHFQQLSAMFK